MRFCQMVHFQIFALFCDGNVTSDMGIFHTFRTYYFRIRIYDFVQYLIQLKISTTVILRMKAIILHIWNGKASLKNQYWMGREFTSQQQSSTNHPNHIFIFANFYQYQFLILTLNQQLIMNLQYPLHDSYHAYKHIEILKLKEKHKIIVIGYTSSENDYSALIISKPKVNQPLKPLKQITQEIGPYHNMEEIKDKLKQKLGEYHCKEIIFGFGIVGFHKFLQGYYMTYISQMETIAMVGRHKINQIVKTQILTLFDSRPENKDKQSKYKKILSQYKLQNYYYSYTYDMTHTLAKNMVRNSKPFYPDSNQEPEERFFSDDPNLNHINELFHFNYGISREMSQGFTNQKWVIAIVHGFCRQINAKLKGTNFKIIVIARRCRHHAGTRYIKRGINAEGFVANYVEVQQIVINFSLSQDTRPVCSSFIQMRGSVPTYWMQRPSIAIPKPSIQTRTNDYLYLATQKHFHDMIGRYGQHIYGINLMKGRQKTIRESGLSKQYMNGIQFINKNLLPVEHSLHYAEVDMKYHLKLDKNLFINKVRTFAYFTIKKTGIFLCLSIDRSTNDQYVEFQNGVIRANCVDCLDRTNSFQQLVGETVLSVQISRLLKEQTKFDKLQLNENILTLYSELYERMGDLISIQYGSSYAHKQKIQKTTEERIELWTSIKRHFNNNLKDYDRQEQIDVFLGYTPQPEGPQIWQTKPSIQHFPSQRVKQFEHYKNYFESAFSFFKSQYSLNLFNSINKKEKFEKSKISHEEEFGREDLKTKFTPQVVNSLVNEKEQSEFFKFCLTPKMVLEKKVWAQMNPQPKQVETLQEKLSKPYNKMQFLNNDDKEVKILELNNHKKYSKEENSPLIKKTAKNINKTQFLLFDDEDIKDSFHDYLENAGKLDEEQLSLIQKYLKNDLVKDQQIEEQISKWQHQLNSTEQVDDMYNKIRIMAEEEIKLIEQNYSNHNYIGPFTKKKVQINPVKKAGNEQNKKMKKGVIKDNRVLMLQKIMKKNFTHGKIMTQIKQI